ncbi:WASH complex subunit 2C isoform X2 [Mixophyes fleayi]|uniref:WASH complex subunit 2C isoform X2 n=1 Tax=Mixophyes fleayi TaxID=3061075 RepID=UPI003F4D82F9
MNGPMSSAADEPVWERPWSLEEIRRSSQKWSLGADAGLLNFLREFSHQTMSRTHDIEKQLDGLVREAKTTECRLHNIFNDFLMLSNTQFIENRVYDEEIEEHIVKSDPGEKPEQEKTREQKEAELIPKIQEAVNYGLQVLETAFEQLDIKAGNSDSEEEEANERVEIILEPKDLYIDRPLPYLIGSQLFMQQEDVGLGDISSEEGSVDNDRGSVIDSEEEDDKENDERTALSDEDEDNGSDLFGDSDKEEEEENDKSTKTRTKSFADELAARIQVEVPKRLESDQSSISSLEVKSKKEKREARKLPSDDEEDDIFKPPKLTDEDFFGNKGGLFSGGKGLFDDDEEEGDLFSDVHGKEYKPTEPPVVAKPEPLPSDVKKKPPYGGVSLFLGAEDVINSSVLADKDKRKLPTPTDAAPQPPNNAGLFGDDDEIFGGSATAEPRGKAKEASDLFADDDDLFNDHNSATSKKSRETEAPKPTIPEKKNVQMPTETSKLPEPSARKQIRGLFSDEDDSESDLFLPSQSAGKSKTATLPTTKTSKSLSLFDDEDEDLFGAVTEKKPTIAAKPVQQSTIPAPVKMQKSGLFSSDEEDPATVSNNIKPVEKSKKDASVPPKPKEERSEKKSSLFSDGDDDLFAITKDSQQKHHRVSLLFEEDENRKEPPFASGVTPTTSIGQPSEQSNVSVSVKVENEKVSLFDGKKPETNAPVQASEDKVPHVLQKTNAIKPVPLQEPDVDDLFAASLLTAKHTNSKSKNVLSLFGDEENDIEDQFPTKITKRHSETDSFDKAANLKSTGVFQDEELLFSQELQKDNDPDVDLFASTNKKSPEKPSSAKLPAGIGLFGDDEDDDLFSTAKPKKPPKVQEKKPVIKKDGLETSKETDILPVVKEKSTDPAKIKTKSPSSRIGKLQANLLINPAALLPGAVPKLSSARTVVPETDFSTLPVAENTRSSDTVDKSMEGASFEATVQVDTLYSANKTRVKVGGKRRPPTRLGRKLASQDSGETEDLSESSPISPTSDTKPKAGFGESNWLSDRSENMSTMKLSFSENDVQSRANPKVAVNPLTPDVNDLFGSDLFAKTLLPNPVVSRQHKEESPVNEFTKKSVFDQGKRSPVVAIDGDSNNDDPFKSAKEKSKKALQPTSVIDNEPKDDLFGIQKPQRKVDVPTKDAKPTTSDIFEDDIFAAEAIKPVKKPKEKKTASEANLFDDHMDIFADLTHKPKEKKSKKKVEPKSIFDDDMDDIFSTSVSNVKKTKPKSKSIQSASETKPDTKVSTAFDDPLNVFGN